MSFVRWAQDGSNVYVFVNEGGGIECYGCGLMDGKRVIPSYIAPDAESMARHLLAHRAAGHVVPWIAFANLLGPEHADALLVTPN